MLIEWTDSDSLGPLRNIKQRERVPRTPNEETANCYIETGTGRDACVLESMTVKKKMMVMMWSWPHSMATCCSCHGHNWQGLFPQTTLTDFSL